MRFRASDVAAATGGRLVGSDVELTGVAFDSRAVTAGQLFVPLLADRDGHEFIPDAVTGGAAAYLTSRPVGPASSGPGVRVPAIEVTDTLGALMATATAFRRDRLSGTVVAITGSVGKTSTKDLARTAIAASRRTAANERSFNNDQGLPTTILNAPQDTEVLIVEMGMRGPGEIARLCVIAAPHVGVVTRVAEAHSERVGGIDGVARAKGELIQALPSSGVAVLNADDHRVRAMRARTDAEVVLFGEAADADVRVTDVQLDELARATCVVHTPWGRFQLRLGVSGRHMVGNAAAAVACAGVVGADVAAGVDALADADLSPMRMQVLRTASGGLIVNDCYNANPTSMLVALDALAAIPARRRIALLGVMAEISDPAAEHRRVAAHAARLGIEVVAVGTELYGPAPAVDPVAAIGSIAGDEALLVKGSRVVGLERYLPGLSGQ